MANKTARFIAGKGGLTVKTVNVVTTQNAAPGQPYPTITQDQTDTRNIPSYQDSQSTVAGLKTFYVPGYVSPNDTAPVLTLPSGTQTGQTTATLAVTTDHTGGTLYTVVSTSATPPSVVQIQAGHDQSGGAGAYASSNASPVAGVVNFSATGLAANTTYYVYFQHHDTFGLDSTISASSSFSTLANPATLSLPTLVATGTTTATVGATTDTGSGTLYFVVTTVNSTPTAAQIIAGHDSTGGAPAYAGNLTPSSGVNTKSATGLTANTTYYGYAAQSSAGGNSNVVGSSSITTDLAPTGLTGLIGWWDASVTASLTLSGSNITAIADQSGTSHNLTNSSTVPYSATGFNTSFPAWSFPNSGASLLFNASLSLGAGGTLTLWWVGTAGIGASSASGRVISYAQGGGSNDFDNAGSFAVGTGSPFTGMDLNRNSHHATIASGNITASPAGHRFIVTIDGSGNETFYVDGVSKATGTGATGSWVTNGEIMFGRSVGFNADYWYGTMAEVGVATGFTSSANVAQLDQYLKRKWGL